jgi:hypothetical protein
MGRSATIVFHGHCFDGMSSAALMARFLREHEGVRHTRCVGLDHQPGGSYVPDEALGGDINAIVDFRYSCSDKLTWWFDHHRTGLVGAHEHEDYAAKQTRQSLEGPRRFFFEPAYTSCCKLIRDSLANVYRWRCPSLDNLVSWADTIDSAGFATPEAAVALDEPAVQLMAVLEVHGSTEFLSPRIDQLSQGVALTDIAQSAEVQRLFAPIAAAQQHATDQIRDHARLLDGVVTFELVGTSTDRYNKFIPYWLFPDAAYVVAVSQGPQRVKVSVGSNPWRAQDGQHSIGDLCARYGGGGHAYVGAVTLEPSQLSRARQVAREIAAVLRDQAPQLSVG